MPYLKIQTNLALDRDTANQLMSTASDLISSELGKPREFVMLALEPEEYMFFDGSDKPVAFLELKAVGLPGKKTMSLSRALSEMIERELPVNRDRIYIKFIDVHRGMWGWNGKTLSEH